MNEHHAWLQTASGRVIDALDTEPDGIEIEDIAWGLSNAPRFVGQTQGFYSVAMHCVECARQILRCPATPIELARWALLHDASEAYLCDIPTPVKQELGDYRRLETRLQNRICRRFGLGLEMPPEVAEVDARMLSTEVRDLLVERSLVWGLLAEPYEFRVAFHTPDTARAMFREMAHRLGLLTAGEDVR